MKSGKYFLSGLKKVFVLGRREHDFDGALNAKDCLEIEETNPEPHMESLNGVNVEKEVGQNKKTLVKIVSVEVYSSKIELLLVVGGRRRRRGKKDIFNEVLEGNTLLGWLTLHFLACFHNRFLIILICCKLVKRDRT